MESVVKKWSTLYDVCVRCSRNDTPHQARGLCRCCYNKERYATNPEIKEKRQARAERYKKEGRKRKRAGWSEKAANPAKFVRIRARDREAYRESDKKKNAVYAWRAENHEKHKQNLRDA